LSANPYFRGDADQGRRPELVGGGLIQSAGGWKQVKKILKGRSSPQRAVLLGG